MQKQIIEKLWWKIVWKHYDWLLFEVNKTEGWIHLWDGWFFIMEINWEKTVMNEMWKVIIKVWKDVKINCYYRIWKFKITVRIEH